MRLFELPLERAQVRARSLLFTSAGSGSHCAVNSSTARRPIGWTALCSYLPPLDDEQGVTPGVGMPLGGFGERGGVWRCHVSGASRGRTATLFATLGASLLQILEAGYCVFGIYLFVTAVACVRVCVCVLVVRNGHRQVGLNLEFRCWRLTGKGRGERMTCCVGR